jgi:hypothetical protein
MSNFQREPKDQKIILMPTLKQIGHIFIKNSSSDFLLKLPVWTHIYLSDFLSSFFEKDDFPPATYSTSTYDFNLGHVVAVELSKRVCSVRTLTLQHFLHEMRQCFGLGTIISISTEFRVVLDLEPFDDTYKEALWQSTLTQA